MRRVVSSFFALAAAAIQFVLWPDGAQQPLVAPKVDLNPFWGPRQQHELKQTPEEQDTRIRPSPIDVPASVLTDLRARLVLETETDESRSRLLPPLRGVAFQYGFNSDYLKRLTRYWLEEYLDKWPERQARLNRFPHFKTRIHGLDIHFQHATANNSTRKYRATRPVLLLNGWPQSFVDFQRVIPYLTEPTDGKVNFEVVIPSLPGFGFSDPARRPGLGVIQAAQIYDALMQRLGYKHYYVHATNWGGSIANAMGTLYPERVRGYHFSTCLTFNPQSIARFAAALISPTPLNMSPEEATVFKGKSLLALVASYGREMGYYYFQSTKPDTIGAGLSNTPTGLAAWVLEKWSGFTNPDAEVRREPDGGLGLFETDDLLDTVMVYWASNSITTSVRLYYEIMSNTLLPTLRMDGIPTDIPTACLQAPHDNLFAMPRWALEPKYKNLKRYTVLSKGGLFIAAEEPEAVGRDIASFFQSI